MKVHTSTLAVLVLLVVPACLFAQDKNAKLPQPQEERENLKGFRTEGGIANVIAGEATYLNQKSASQILKPGQEFESGDEIRVGQNSYVEVLLNPGSCLRLSPYARIRFLDLSPDNLKVKLLSGSIILESFLPLPGTFERSTEKQSPGDLRTRFEGGYQSITVVTPSGDFLPAHGGLYRCDLNDDGRGLLKVVKGVAVISGGLLSDGMSAALGDRMPFIQNFDTAREDNFDQWSHHRAIALVELNKSLRTSAWKTQLRKNHLSYLSIQYDESITRMKEALTVSAVGGSVGFAEAGAEYQSQDTSWAPLTPDVELKFGDHVRTIGNARAEIHLYPECYLLLAGNTEIVYGARRDNGASVKLINGSAIIVSSLLRKDGVLTSLLAPEAEIEIPEAGVYRLNVHPHRQSELLVYQGRATIDGQEIKEIKRAVFGEHNFEVGPIRRMDVDPFELWSRKRSELLIVALNLVQAHHKVDTSKNRTPAPIVPQSAHRLAATGMWYLDPTANAYTFVPESFELTSSRSVTSPYGGQYSVSYRTEFARIHY